MAIANPGNLQSLHNSQSAMAYLAAAEAGAEAALMLPALSTAFTT